MEYELLEHEADIGIRGYGDTIEEAFENGAKAMFSIMVDLKKVNSQKNVKIKCEAPDIEALFVEWLNELLTKKDIEEAKSQGKRWKLIGSSEIQKDGSVKAKVWPEKLPLNNPLAGVMEATNALTYYTDELGPVTIVGPGAGKRETGFALLIDLLNINRKLVNKS